MKNRRIINQLKKFKEDEFIKITIIMDKKRLNEVCFHKGTWNGKSFSCDSITTWRTAELFTEEMFVHEIIDLLKNKDKDEMDYRDFIGLSLVESTDANIEIENIFWDEFITEQESEDFNEMDLYWNSEITDSEYKFDVGSIESIKIEAGENFEIELN